MVDCWWYFMFTSISRPTDSTWWVPNMIFITIHTSQLYINDHALAIHCRMRFDTIRGTYAFFLRSYLCLSACSKCFVMIVFAKHIYGSKPAAWPPPSTPAALVWTAPLPICSTEQRGGSVSSGPVWATRQLNGTFVGIILPSLITKCPWQWGFTPTSPYIQSFVSFLLFTVILTS